MDSCQFFLNFLKYFTSLGLKARTTSYSCSEDDDDYGENLLLSRPLPWVVRVHFQYENSLRGSLCSGKTWIYLSNFVPLTAGRQYVTEVPPVTRLLEGPFGRKQSVALIIKLKHIHVVTVLVYWLSLPNFYHVTQNSPTSRFSSFSNSSNSGF